MYNNIKIFLGDGLKMIKAVIFDLDGTLLNRDESVIHFINNQYERLLNWLGFIKKENYISRFIEIDNRGYVWKDKVYKQLIDEFGIKGINQEELLRDYLNNFRYHCVPFQNLNCMLVTLMKMDIKLAIITNGKGQFQFDNINSLGIKNYFQEILISEWEGVKKPDSQIFRRALERLNVLPNETLFVGDHPLNDIKAAKDVGMQGIWKRDSQWSSVDADFIVNDLSEIPLIIEKVNKVNLPSY